MRILTVGNMYPPHHLGGYELTWRSAVEHLRAAGHEVEVLTTDFRVTEPDPAFPEDPATHRELRWYWRDHEFPAMSARERITLERHNGRVLARRLQSLRPDVVNWWAMGGMSMSLIERVRRLGLPAVGVVGDDWIDYGPRVDGWQRMARRLGPAGPALGRLVNVPAKVDLSAPTWLFNSAATRDAAVAATGYPLPRAEVVHPGVDDALFVPAPPHDWGWRLLHVGRLDERKGIDTAIESLTHLPPETHLTVLGSGDDRYLRDLRGLCARLGLEERVRFDQVPRGELAAAYADADALLFPVRWEEPWGLVPLEAMAVGTPVVATGTGGSREYLRDRENALVVGRAAGAADLARAVSALSADPELRARIRQNGLATASGYTERGYNEAIEAALLQAVG